jgi:hypothetical protein
MPKQNIKIKKKHIDKFINITDKLDLLIKEIQEYCPQAHYYVGDGRLYLLNKFDETHNRENRESIISAEANITDIDGGGW